jgi:hypothetical protein
MSFRYTPQAPTALSNGPTIIEAQVDTIVDMIKKLESEKARSIEPKREAEIEWKQICHNMMQYTLIPYTNRSANVTLCSRHMLMRCIAGGMERTYLARSKKP